MDSNNISEEPMVPPVLDKAEFSNLSGTQTPLIEAEPVGLDDIPLDTAEQQGLLSNAGADPPPLPEGPTAPLPARPALRRDGSIPAPVPAPLHLPPPAPPAPPETTAPPESLSIQLRSLATELPKADPTPYAFAYNDASSLQDELEEWFTYSVEEQAMLLKAHTSFAQEWGSFCGSENTNYEDGGLDWTKADQQQQKDFVQHLLGELNQSASPTALNKLEALVYILLGCWHESAGLASSELDRRELDSQDSKPSDGHTIGTYDKSGHQVELIRENVRLCVELGGLPDLIRQLRFACLRACGVDAETNGVREGRDAERCELWCSMTVVYVILEVARVEETEKQDLTIRSAIVGLEEPGLLMLLVEIISKLRWDDSIALSMSKIGLLLWKAVLVTFGGLSDVEKAKDSFKDKTAETEDTKGHPLITASPLDYHLFRQEILSKYPAYNPPPPIFPLEPENNSILPPLKNHPNKVAGNHIFGSGLGDMTGSTSSILHQPVHIATPAPSPPPSPAGPGGKGGKKQNYQTNQMFPFLYPPLDETSNKLGGKGSTDLQDLLVGRKWEGSDIPASILEAADLFAKRMRATRAMKQLWEERVRFMKYERGWSGPGENTDIEELSLDAKDNTKETPAPGSTEERLNLVEDFYRKALPSLQSVVIVLIRGILSHVTALVTQANGANGLQGGMQYQDNQNMGARTEVNGVNGHDGTIPTNEELDTVRVQEVLDKAVSGTLMLILKWFKVSHILKYEYITQLLVDSSYVPLILKLLQLQEIEKVVNFKCEQEELNFFQFCRSHSRLGADQNPPADAPSTDSDSDSALPPPIRRHRSPSPSVPSPTSPLPAAPPQPPEVDELGFPTTEMPSDPITRYSWRAFFTTINYLRIMQKICKNKAHRNLMLVSYKSSQFLRKSLKVPEPHLRLYTLKLFKNQVPYCGRKWRQTNMRVITAVYLHCRPELRDDWLAGSDVDADVDESVPLEQALRALTHWFNLKRYPEGMGARLGVLEEEQDFFRRELEKMEQGAEEDPDLEPVSVEGW